MEKLKCELCGSVSFTKTDDGMYMCDYCGCKYTKDQAVAIISGTVETTIGSSEFNRLVSNAEKQIELNQNASETINRIIKEFPAEYQGYYLYIKYLFNLVNNSKSIYDLLFEADKVKEYYQVLIKILDNHTSITKEGFYNYWNSCFEKIYSQLVEGTITGLYRCYHFPSNYDVHPLISKAHDLGYNNANVLNQNNIYIFRNNAINKEQLFLFSNSNYTYPNTIRFVFGKELTFTVPYDNDYTIMIDYSIENAETNISEILKKAEKDMLLYVHTYYKCLCGNDLHSAFFGNKLKCSKCKTVYDRV